MAAIRNWQFYWQFIYWRCVIRIPILQALRSRDKYRTLAGISMGMIGQEAPLLIGWLEISTTSRPNS